jgi:hypothetical protein
MLTTLKKLDLQMRKMFLSLGVLLMVSATAQTVTYTPSTAVFPNPERGFYKHYETGGSSYSQLSQNSLTNNRVNSGYTLILRLFYLDAFVNSPISSTYLSNMQSDFTKMRAAGVKCIIRFAYSDDPDDSPLDATKAQVLAHINQVKPILQANADVIACVQAGFVGAWGEWYYTDNFGFPPNATDYANRRDIVNALLDALPAGKMVQLRTPKLKRTLYNTNSPLTLTQAFTDANIARVGHHNDCFLASSTDEGTYDNIAVDYPYLEQETRFTPMGGESCSVNLPRSGCETAVFELNKFHWSYMNVGYHPGVLEDFSDGGCYSEIEKKLGYRFEMVNATYPQQVAIGSPMAFTLNIRNVGFATPYSERTPYLIFRNTATNAEYSVALESDPRFWTSGGEVTELNENIALPSNIVPGSYKLFLHLPDADAGLVNRPEYSIRFANNNTWDAVKGYNDLLHTMIVSSPLAVGEHQTARSLTVYPVPAGNELVMEMEGIEDYSIAVHNSLGQQIRLSHQSMGNDKIILNTESLSNGVYFVSVENGSVKETRRIIVSH